MHNIIIDSKALNWIGALLAKASQSDYKRRRDCLI